RVSGAIGFDGRGDGLKIGERLLFVAADGGLVPFNFKGRKIKKEHADRDDFPGGVFADEAHEDAMRVPASRRVGIGSVAYVDGEQRELVAKVRAAQLDVRSAVWGGAANRRAAGVDRQSRLAGTVEQNKPLHEFDPCGGSEAGKRFGVAGSEEL